MFETYGHPPIPNIESIRREWQDGLQQFQELLEAAGTPVVIVLTAQVGRRPGSASGVHGSAMFAHAAEVAFRIEGRPELDWLITYHHEERFFVGVRRGYIAHMRKQLGGQPL